MENMALVKLILILAQNLIDSPEFGGINQTYT
jgi:hypothetical protein